MKKLGLSVCSLFSLQDAPEVDVLSYSTDSRGVASQEAYHRVCDAFTCLGKGTDFCNKRIDSTPRGNIGAEIDAIAITPINKEALRAAHVNYIGHTEILGALSHSRDPLTMFEVDGLRVFFLTRHMSLREACDAVKKDRVLEYIRRCTKALQQLGVKGKMAVAGLNPHSGEHGLFGWEEVKEIAPAVAQAQQEGYDVVGPIGPDSVFHQALQGRYQAVLSLYHDQGHIATKTYDFERTIAVTLDMPFLRTSVDHGTAFDIAGKGIVSDISMIEAIRLAAKYAPNFVQKQA